MSGWPQLLAGLSETSRALSAGDALGAAEGMRVVERVREELRASRTPPPDAATLQQARALLDRCTSGAAEVQGRLEAELAQAGHGRRAANAYGARLPRR